MIEVSVCIGSACHLKGSHRVIKELQNIISERNLSEKIELKAAFCLGECTKAVSVRVNNDYIVSVNDEKVLEFFNEHLAWRV